MQTAGGEAYTRNGQLAIDSTGILKTRGGQVVMGENGPLTVPENTRVIIAPDGTVTGSALNDPTQRVEIGKLKLVNPDESLLVKNSQGLLQLSDGSQAESDDSVQVAAGFLEGSNVNPIDELINSMSLTRNFELQVKLMQSVDAQAQQGNELISG